MLAVALCVAACAEPRDAPGLPGEEVWMRQYDGRGHGADRALAVVADGAGVVVAGWETDQTEDADLWLARYRANGKRDWVHREDAGPGAGLFASDIVRLADGGLVVAGGVYSEEHDWDIWIHALSPGLEPRWSRTIEGGADADDEAVAISLAPDGRLLVAGFMSLADGTADAVVHALDSDGEVLWEHRHDGAGAGIDAAIELVALPDGDVAVAGYSTSDVQENDWDIWLRRLDAEGQEVWTVLREAKGGDRAQAIARAPNGDLVVGGFVYVSGAALDAWLARYTAGGDLLWERSDDGPGSFADAVNDVTVTDEGTIVAGGYDFVDDEGFDAWVRHHDGDGTLLWSHREHGPGRIENQQGELQGGDDVTAAVVVHEDGHVYAVGSFTMALDAEEEIWDVDAFVRKLGLEGPPDASDSG
jgi:uncharacterized delta-60 repeat protein